MRLPLFFLTSFFDFLSSPCAVCRSLSFYLYNFTFFFLSLPLIPALCLPLSLSFLTSCLLLSLPLDPLPFSYPFSSNFLPSFPLPSLLSFLPFHDHKHHFQVPLRRPLPHQAASLFVHYFKGFSVSLSLPGSCSWLLYF